MGRGECDRLTREVQSAPACHGLTGLLKFNHRWVRDAIFNMRHIQMRRDHDAFACVHPMMMLGGAVGGPWTFQPKAREDYL